MRGEGWRQQQQTRTHALDPLAVLAVRGDADLVALGLQALAEGNVWRRRDARVVSSSSFGSLQEPGPALGRLTRLDVAPRADRQARDVKRLGRLEVEERRARRREHDGRRQRTVGARLWRAAEAVQVARDLALARRGVALVEVLQDARLLALGVDRARVALVPPELVGLLVEQGLARVAPLGRREFHEQLLVALDDDGQAVVAEPERLLRLERDDVVDRDDHLREGGGGASAGQLRKVERGKEEERQNAPSSW